MSGEANSPQFGLLGQARTEGSLENMPLDELSYPLDADVLLQPSNGHQIPVSTQGVDAPGSHPHQHSGFSQQGTDATRPAPLHDPHLLQQHHQQQQQQQLQLQQHQQGGPLAEFVCSVDSPSKVSGASSIPGVEESYWVFPITTTATNHPNGPVTQNQTWRRFRDCVSLSELLMALLPGYFLPMRPHRNAVATRRGSARFLEDRRAGLERYLNRLAFHPVASKCEALNIFLTSQGDLRSNPSWIKLQSSRYPRRGLLDSTARFFKQLMGREVTAPFPSDISQSARASGDVFRLLREQMAQLQGLHKSTPASPSELALRDAGAQLEDVRVLLAALSSRADVLVERASGKADATAALGRALQACASHDDAFSKSLQFVEASTAGGLLRASQLRSLASDLTAKHLTALHDHLASLPAAQGAMACRERALLTVVTLEVALARRAGALDAARSQDPTSQRARMLQADVEGHEAALDVGRQEYDKLAERNASEMVSWGRQLRADFMAMAKEFAMVQMSSAEKEHVLWTETHAALMQEHQQHQQQLQQQQQQEQQQQAGWLRST